MVPNAKSILLTVGLTAVLSLGCRTPTLDAARNNFYANRLALADQRLESLPPDRDKDKILFLMERGTIHQARNDLEASTADWLRAVSLLDQTEPYSLSRGAVSLIINDETMIFRGLPYERTLLRSMLAQNFLLRGQWQSAGVEARNIIEHLEHRNGFPDDAFSRYVAGFCLEMLDDREGAALQYRSADALLDNLSINDRSGRLQPVDDDNRQPATDDGVDWIIFVMLGRGPGRDTMLHRGRSGHAAPGYVEFFSGARYHGRSYPLSNTGDLHEDSLRRIAVLQASKDVTRIVIKETIVQTLLRENEGLGLLASILLYSTEGPDTRRWETLPRSLQVARFKAPADLRQIDMVIRDDGGRQRQTRHLTAPFTRRNGAIVALVRDHPPFPPSTVPGPE